MAVRNVNTVLLRMAALALLLSLVSLINIGTASADTSDIKINEVESTSVWLVSGPAVSEDWIELYNNGTTPVDISGLKLQGKKSSIAKYSIPPGTVLAAGAYLAITDAALGFGLGSSDLVRLFATDGTTVLDSYTWTSHATTTYGRCPNGTGSFVTTLSPSKGTANNCPVLPPAVVPELPFGVLSAAALTMLAIAAAWVMRSRNQSLPA